MNDDLIDQFEQLIRRDPGQRGLLGQQGGERLIATGSLRRAARDLATSARNVVLVTGFYIPGASIPASETDGPPGTLYLARLLELLDINVEVVTDVLSATAVTSVATHVGFPADRVHAVPLRPEPGWCREFFESGPGQKVTHLVAIERAGPGYTSTHFQQRYPHLVIDDFLRHSPVERQGSCHNMRGININEWNAPLFELFERITEFHPAARTIGVGDGGNEIGMGCLEWELIQECLPLPDTSHIPCRIMTDELIVAGTSNWGALALAAAVAHLRGKPELLVSWTAEHHLEMLERMVAEGPAVDGVTGRCEATVDGLPYFTYIQPWLLMRKLLEI